MVNVSPHIEIDNQKREPDQNNDTEINEISTLLSSLHTVLGFDIYHYSQYEVEQQILIPPLFNYLYSDSWNLVKQNYSYIFQDYDNMMRTDAKNHVDYFISTGDGGYQIIDTPIHAILFLIVFATILRFYNSGLYFPLIYEKVGTIDIRYAISYDNLYKYNGNYYGAAIINNSRMMSKDKLNRLLIDKNTNDWFLRSIYGIENLMSIGLEDISRIKEFVGYSKDLMMGKSNAVIQMENEIIKREGIKAVDIQKITETQEKNTRLNIYNLHLQATIDYRSFFETQRIVTVSIGNLNTDGIS